MKDQALIEERRRIANMFDHGQIKDMNVAFRQMRNGGIPITEFNQIFPGNSFIDFTDRSRKIKKLRKRINSDL